MLLKNGNMPYLDKRLLKLDYIDVGKELTELCKALENNGGLQNSEKNIIFTKMKIQFNRFECIKDRHENLILQFKNHRKSLLFHICQFFSHCC